MKLLHVVSGAWKNIGGPAEVIPQLCSTLQSLGCDVTMVTVSGDLSDSMLKARDDGVELLDFPSSSPAAIRYTPGLAEYLRLNASKFDVIHNHGHWLHPNWAAAKYSDISGTPLVTTPHGTLVPGMLKKSRWKKLLAWQAFDRRLIRQASVIHCLTPVESELTSLWIPHKDANKLTVIPNGVELPVIDVTDISEAKSGFPSGKRKLLYLSRVHKIKGVLDLVAVWEKLKPAEWELVIIGPIEEDLVESANSWKANPTIHVLGPVYGDQRFKYLHAADAFVLPSYAEGLPTALLEASAAGKAIVATRECNFVDLEDARAAIVCNAGVAGLEKALSELFSMDQSSLRALGERAARLVEDRYSWKGVATRWMSIYQNLALKQ